MRCVALKRILARSPVGGISSDHASNPHRPSDSQQPQLRELEGSQGLGCRDQADLDAFAEGQWGQKFPTVSASWRSAWDRVIPFFAFPPDMRSTIFSFAFLGFIYTVAKGIKANAFGRAALG